MSLIRQIKIGISADTGKLSASVRGAVGDLDKLTEASRQAQAAVGSLDVSKTRGGSSSPSSGGASGSASDATTGALLAIGPRIEASLARAMGPLTQIGANLGEQFNKLGGVIVEASRRMADAARVLGGQALKDVFAHQNPNPEKFGVVANARSFRNAIGTGTQEKTSIRNIPGAATADAGYSRVNATLGEQSQLLRKATTLSERYGTTAVGWSKKLRVDPKFASFLSEKDIGLSKPLEKMARLNLSGAAGQVGRIAKAFPTVATTADAAASSVRRVGAEMAVAFGLVGLAYKATSAIVGFFKGGISGAADLGETLSKTRAILGDSSAAVETFASEVSGKFGLVKKDVLDAGGSFAGLGKGLGDLKGQQLSDFSIRFTQLAADLQSFANTDTLAEATKALTIGLSGEQSDVLKRLGVIVNETTIKQYALANGISKTGISLSEQQKLAARAGIIQEKLADANGDLARTFGSTKNAGRAFSGTLTNLAVSIGQAFEPSIAAGIGLLNQFALAGVKAFNDYRPAIEGFASGVANAFGVVGVIFRNFGPVAQIAFLTAKDAAQNFINLLATVPENFGIIAEYLRSNWFKVLTDIYNATRVMSDNIDTNISNLFHSLQDFFAGKGFNFNWTPMLEGFKATADQFPELIKPAIASSQTEIDTLMGKIAENEARAKGPGPAGGKSPFLKLDGGDGSGGGAEDKYRGTAAARLGSQEASSVLSRFRNQSGGDDASKQTATNTKSMAETLKSVAESLAYMKNAKASGNATSLAIAKL